MARNSSFDWTAIAMGLPIGIGIGVALDNVLLGIPIGIMFGIAFGGSRSSPDAGEETESPDREPGD